MSVLVTKSAPDFTAKAVMPDGSVKGDFQLSKNFGPKGTVLFFYPLDFTFVCPTEIIAFDHRLDEFKKRGVNVIGVSVDSHWSHVAWRSTPLDKGGIGPIKYPIVSDLSKSIARDYDVLLGNEISLRGSFLIDAKGIVQHQVVNSPSLGRNIDEMLRMVDAMQFNEEHGEVCPAGWNKGAKAMKANPDGVASYLREHALAL